MIYIVCSCDIWKMRNSQNGLSTDGTRSTASIEHYLLNNSKTRLRVG